MKTFSRREVLALVPVIASGVVAIQGCGSSQTSNEPSSDDTLSTPMQGSDQTSNKPSSVDTLSTPTQGSDQTSNEPSSDDTVSAPTQRSDQLIHLAPYVSRLKKWEAGDLFIFCNAMMQQELESLAKALELEIEIDNNDPQLKAPFLKEVHKEILWLSSNVFEYQLKSIEKIDYHGIVAWCAKKVGIDSATRSFTSTFDLEQEIVKRQFVEIWDKLSESQRRELLEKLDSENKLEDHAAIAAMAGSAALAALSTSVYFAGFAFYTSMSVVIATVAGWFGVTLPFAAYTSASSTVAVLAGPIGWALGAVLLAAAVAWTGRANVKKTTAVVMQLHALKAGALYCNGEM